MRIHLPNDDGKGGSVDLDFPASFNFYIESVLGLEKDGDTAKVALVTRVDVLGTDEFVLMMTKIKDEDG
jgi:hypothetical protein